MLNCQQVTEIVTEYLEGRMSLRRKLSFHFHLGMCRHCREYLRQMKITVATLGMMPPEGLPPGVRDALIARLKGMKAP